VERGIRVVGGGPYVVSGGVPLVRLERVERGPGGRPSWRPGARLDTTEPYSLCRCGRSTRKPFCDAANAEACWVEPGGGSDEPLPVTWTIDGLDAPALALKPNGPIRVLGVPIAHGDGTPFPRAERCSLCRCGSSGAMPFCDGTHKAVGFRDA
jgi:CDGSH-type Zn-finger protein